SDTHVTGPVLMKSATGASLYLAGAETGPIALNSGNGALGGAAVEVAAGTTTIHGDLKVTGSRLSIVTRTGGTLFVDRGLSLIGSGFADLTMGYGSTGKP